MCVTDISTTIKYIQYDHMIISRRDSSFGETYIMFLFCFVFVFWFFLYLREKSTLWSETEGGGGGGLGGAVWRGHDPVCAIVCSMEVFDKHE